MAFRRLSSVNTHYTRIYSIEEIFIEVMGLQLNGFEMSKQWYDLATGKLDPTDRIQKTYSCSFEEKNGYLCLTNDKLLFVSIKGFLKKSYNVELDVPYNELNEVKLDGRYKINIAHQTGEGLIETSVLSAKTVLGAIQDLVKQSPSKAKVVFLDK
jgi:hypothetical protein